MFLAELEMFLTGKDGGFIRNQPGNYRRLKHELREFKESIAHQSWNVAKHVSKC